MPVLNLDTSPSKLNESLAQQQGCADEIKKAVIPTKDHDPK